MPTLSARRPAVAAMMATAVILAACGGGDADDSASTDTTAAAVDDTPTTAAPEAVEPVDLDETIWFAGFEVTLETASVTTDEFGIRTVEVEASFENIGPDSATFDGTVVLESGNRGYPTSSVANVPNVPGGSSNNGSFLFEVDEGFTLEDAVLTIGTPAVMQAVVPLGAEGDLVTLEPVELEATGETTAGDILKVELTSGELRADIPESHRQTEAGQLALTLVFDLTDLSDFAGGYAFGPSNLALTLPDGTTISPDESPVELLQPLSTLTDQEVRFLVDEPAEGDYELVLIDDTATPEPIRSTLAFTIPAP